MSKSMLINVILEEESRVAIVDNGIMDFFEIETRTKETLKGNIYKGVVENVNASLDAAFVDCGWERPGFLPLDEVNFRILPVLKGRKGSGSKIQDHLHPGMELLVQVIRDRIGTKPPSVTTYYSLPGRYLVLTPYADSSGVSRRIEDEDRRAKLKKIVDELRPPEKYGFIVRTAGLDQDRKELARDMGYLLRLWETIEQAAGAARAPSLIYRERGLALRTIRDHLTDDVEEVLIDDEDVHESALRFIRAVAPHQEGRIKLYTGDKPLFTRFNLEEQIETIYKRRVPLKSGGEIVIEGTEGMTAVDVNSSRSRESSVEELAVRTNLEAAAEVARQLRLRDIGGLIVIDFIDMEKPKHLRSVEKMILDSMRPDKAKYDATKISKLGMMEISRQRLKAAKSTATYVSCPGCDGAGSVKTTEAAALSALRKIQTRVVRGDIGTLGATLPTDVALYLLNQQRDELQALERRYDVRISVVPRPDYPKERCELEVAPREGPAPAVTRGAQKRLLEEREATRGSAPRRSPAVGDDASLDEALRRGSLAPEGAAPRPAPKTALGTAGATAGAPAEAPTEDMTEPEPVGRAQASTAGAPAPALEAPLPAEAVPGTSVWPALEPEAASVVPVDRRLGWADTDTDIRVEHGETLAPGEVRDVDAEAVDEGDEVVDEGDEPPANHAPLAGLVSAEVVSAGSDHDPDAGDDDGGPGETAESAAAHKRRRRRGGRGRKKHGTDTPGVMVTAQVKAAPAARKKEEKEKGGIVWEDVPDDDARDHTSAAHGAASAGGASAGGEPDEAGHEGPAGAKKRRRRRGGRGRGKASGAEDAAQHPDDTKHATVPAVRSATVKPAHADEHDAGEIRKKRRRRRKKHEGGPGEAAEPVVSAVVAGRSVKSPRTAQVSVPGDEDIPGGWWSRLRGPKKRGDRED